MVVNLPANTKDFKKTGNIAGSPEKPVTEIITNGFFTVDNQWKVIYWNKAAEKLLGVQSKDIVGKNIWKEFVGVIPVEFYAVYHKAFLQDIPVHFEEYWGEMGVWFDVIAYHSDDSLSVSFKTSRQPEKSDQPLRILNELYRLVTEITNDCLWEWDLQTREIFWIDGGHKRVFGYQIENALIPQKFWESLIHPDDKVRVLSNLNNIITAGSVNEWKDEYRFQKADGDYAYVRDRGHIIYDETKNALRMIGATHDVTENVLLEKKLVVERLTRQRELTAAVFTAQENERADIGKELHDNLGQILAVANLYMQMAKKSEKNREKNIEKSCSYIVNVIDEIRKISKNLVIPGTHIIGLFDNIKNLIHDLSKIHTIKIEFYKDGIDEDDLDEKIQLTIFRIVQEQVNNIIRHSNASQASIRFSRADNKLIFLISDNGQGHDILLKENNGVGVINIKSRVGLYNGEISITTKPGEGYVLKIILPLNNNE